MEEEKKAEEDSQFDADEKLALLSKVIKSGSVETFGWDY